MAINVESRLNVGLSYDKKLGCPYLVMTLINRGSKAVKVRHAEIRLRGPLFQAFLRSSKEAFGMEIPYSPLPGDLSKDDNVAIAFLPGTPRTSPHGYVVEQDDVCKFVLPA